MNVVADPNRQQELQEQSAQRRASISTVVVDNNQQNIMAEVDRMDEGEDGENTNVRQNQGIWGLNVPKTDYPLLFKTLTIQLKNIFDSITSSATTFRSIYLFAKPAHVSLNFRWKTCIYKIEDVPGRILITVLCSSPCILID